MREAHHLRSNAGRTRARGPLRAVGLLAILLPPAIILALIWTEGVNVPFHDEWSLVPFVLKANAGQVTLSDLFAQHNEHRIATIRLLILLLLPLTSFDVVAHMLVAFAMAVAALGLFWRAAQRTLDPHHVPPIMLGVSLLIFSVVQHEAWLFSLPAMQWQLTTLCVSATVWALARWPSSYRSLAVAGSCAVVSMYALASGFVLWVAAVVVLLLVEPSQHGKRRWIILGAGILGTALLLWALLDGYEAASARGGSLAAIWMPRSVGRFVAQYFAAPFALFTESRQWITRIGAAGLLIAAATVLMAWRIPAVPRSVMAPWLALWVYAFGVGIVTAIGRVGYSPNAALVRRYPAAAALLWIATIVLGSFVWTDVRQRLAPARRRIVGACVAVLLCLAATAYIANYHWAYRELIRRQRNTELAREELLLFRTTAPIVFEFLYPPDPAIVPKYSELLEKAALGPFASSFAR